jgi:hypothetical protein
MIATAATLALSVAVAAPASAKSIVKIQTTKSTPFGSVSKTTVFGKNDFGGKFKATRIVINPAGPGKIIATKFTKVSPFGGTVTVTKVRKVGF